jgi:glycosyltransferase involved in cell wall biosynthesis
MAVAGESQLPYRLLLAFQATQSAGHADRGIARYVKEHARALARLGVGDAYLLNPNLPFPHHLDLDLLVDPRLRWATRQDVRRLLDDGDTRPLALLLTSPFEITPWADADVPLGLVDASTPLIVTLYDLIPLIMAERYLQDPTIDRRYRARLEVIRDADLVLAISEHTRNDACRLLGLDAGQVEVIGAGIAPFFRPAATGEEPRTRLRHALPELTGPFVLSVVGDDPRKNTERLIEAWSQVPADVRGDLQLVLACSVSEGTRAAWLDTAARAGLPDHGVLVTGFVAEDVLRALYQSCTLHVTPSLYEGSWLPVGEAAACGAPTITSSATSLPEMLDWAPSVFDPTDVDDIADRIERGLADEAFTAELRRRGAVRAAGHTWDAVARRTVDAIRRLHRPRRAAQPRKRRVALVGPMPPIPSGIATYNAGLLPHLAELVDVDVFTPSPLAGQPTHPGVRWFPARALRDTCTPYAYDAVVYTAGNSDDHHDLYELAREFPGVLWLHDVRLPGLVLTYARDRIGLTDWADRHLQERVARQYGRRRPPSLLAAAASMPTTVFIDHGMGLAGELVAGARSVIVSSPLAEHLLRLDLGPNAPVPPVDVLPLAFPSRGPLPRAVPHGDPVVATFGHVSPVRGAETLVEAFAQLVAAGVRGSLELVGPIPDDYRAHLADRIESAGLGDRVRLVGHVDDGTYWRHLATATLAVQLQRSTNGESSSALLDCLAAGLPTLTNVASAAALPAGVTARVPFGCDAATLAAEIGRLLGDPARLDALSAASRAHAASWGFAAVAERLVEIIDRVDAAPAAR